MKHWIKYIYSTICGLMLIPIVILVGIALCYCFPILTARLNLFISNFWIFHAWPLGHSAVTDCVLTNGSWLFAWKAAVSSSSRLKHCWFTATVALEASLASFASCIFPAVLNTYGVVLNALLHFADTMVAIRVDFVFNHICGVVTSALVNHGIGTFPVVLGLLLSLLLFFFLPDVG